jgi:hypothetical protein
VNIYFHIIRNTDGTQGFNPTRIDEIFDNLNRDYNNHDIFFNNLGINFIKQTSSLNIESKNEANLLANEFNRSDAINFYIADNIWGNYSGKAITIPSINVFMENAYALSPVSSHEVGHALNLEHTSRGSPFINNSVGCAEAINGSNCETCGDFVCDTPADPGFNVAGYSPLLTNLMSLYTFSTLDSFTAQQADRMHLTLNEVPLLAPIWSSSCRIPELDEVNFLCDEDLTLMLNNLDTETASWQTSSNVNIVSFTSDSITIARAPFSISNEGWVEAQLSSGLTIRKDFWIGVPDSTGLYIMTSGQGYQISSNLWYQLTAHHSNYNTLEHSNLTYEWNIPYAQSNYSLPQKKVVMVFATQEGVFPYKLRSKNDCGCSDWETFMFQVSAGPGPGDTFISPLGPNGN